ncbi:MAG: nicotinate-nucleotide adenylyltransferase [Candidatus Omnitrophica bacterium]|nr:nicotinate-nucleotide adenylyltransferase [Candidatus Omnitrophota bacterium]
MKVAILGGTFDPVHNGHIALAQAAVDAFSLDKIIFVPVYSPSHKSEDDIADAEDRFSMVKLAIGNNDKFEALRLEINRRNKSYSIDTITYLKKIYPKSAELFFLLGSDSANTLDSWKEVDKIFTLCKFIVGVRPAYTLEVNHKNIEVMSMEPVDISSTQIRQRVKENKSIRGLVPDKVAEYIERFKLYTL